MYLQHANDSFMVRRHKQSVDELVRLLKLFNTTSRYELTRINHMRIGLINTHTSWNSLHGTTRNRPKKGTFLNY